MAEKKGLDAVRAAKRKVVRLLRRRGLSAAVGITEIDGAYALNINFQEPPDLETPLPSQIDGVPLIARSVGRVRKALEDALNADPCAP